MALYCDCVSQTSVACQETKTGNALEKKSANNTTENDKSSQKKALGAKPVTLVVFQAPVK